MRYTKLDASGIVVGSGVCMDGTFDMITPPPGGRLLRDILPPADKTKVWRWTGDRFVSAGSIVPVSYAGQRRAAYPTTGDQLDMLWHAMNDGVLPKVEPFYSDIKAVKARFPKPSN